MDVAAFDFVLPPDRIATEPVRPRDAARMLIVGPAGPADAHMRDLPGRLDPGDLLVVNDTRVIPALLRARRGAASVSLNLLRRTSEDGTWEAMARPAKRLRAGDRLVFADGTQAELVAIGGAGLVRLRFDLAEAAFNRFLGRVGATPLPHYIRRPGGASAADRRDYQTAYAAHDGAVAAPTAGLHLTPRLLSALRARGVGIVAVTLHVGAGTFLPVKTERTEDHVMHAEAASVSAATAAAVNRCRAAGRRVVAVGTTSLRALETAAGDGGVGAYHGDTALFITPGYRFRAVDRLLTNFHLPRSTLFMLVAAFAGLDRMRAAYAHAIAAGYRFYSYGDACLLDLEGGR